MYKILVVEDDWKMIRSIKDHLENDDKYKVYGYNNSKEALDSIKSTTYNLILLDYFLNNENGHRILNDIRKINKNVFVCIFTGFSEDFSPSEALNNLDIQGYIDKKMKFSDLITSIKSFVKSSCKAHEIRESNNSLKSEFFKSNNVFGKRLKNLRESRNISQDDLAKMLGLKRTSITNYENGLSEPNLTNLGKLAIILMTSIDYLVGIIPDWNDI